METVHTPFPPCKSTNGSIVWALLPRHPALNTLRHPGLHPVQLQLSCQVSLRVDSPGITQLAATSPPGVLPGHVLHEEPRDRPELCPF